jgi:hypothetical protein
VHCLLANALSAEIHRWNFRHECIDCITRFQRQVRRLLEGVLSPLSRALPDFSDVASLRLLAEKVAAGAIAGLSQSSVELAAADPHGAIVHGALVHGFRLVMLYGMTAAWALALPGFFAFGGASVREANAGARHPVAWKDIFLSRMATNMLAKVRATSRSKVCKSD